MLNEWMLEGRKETQRQREGEKEKKNLREAAEEKTDMQMKGNGNEGEETDTEINRQGIDTGRGRHF